MLKARRARALETQRVQMQAKVAADLESVLSLQAEAQPEPEPEPKLEPVPALPAISLSTLKIQELLGIGQTSSVRRAVSALSAEEEGAVAVKIVSKRQFFANKRMAENCRRELALLAVLMSADHPHIVQTLGFAEEHGNIYIAMEYCAGGELLQRDGGFSEDDAALITRQLAETLHFLHSQYIVHRDVKPENILFKAAPDPLGWVDPRSLKLCDFGLAVTIKPGGTLCDVCGSPAYVAPEMTAASPPSYGAAVDIYALGVVMFVMLTDRLPFVGSSLHDMAPVKEKGVVFSLEAGSRIGEQAQDLIRLMLTPDQEMRPDADAVCRHSFCTAVYR